MVSLREVGVSFDHWCFACGRENPSGLHLDLHVSGGRATARFTGSRDHQGYEDHLHGGIVTALLDETMGWSFFHRGIWAVTTRLTVTFRRPVPLGEELVVSGWVVRERTRAIEAAGEIALAADGTLLASAEAMFMRMPEERRSQIEGRYRIDPGTFERVREAVRREEEERVALG